MGMGGTSEKDPLRNGPPMMTPEPPTHQPPVISSTFVVMFYGGMSVLAWVLGSFADLDLILYGEAIPIWIAVALGTLVGGGVVGLSRSLEERFAWAQRLSREFQKLLGDLSDTDIAILAVASSVGEELLFRGFLQQALEVHLFSGPYGYAWAIFLSGLLFGLIHVGGSRVYLPWTVMAIVMGWVLGYLFWATGHIAAPVATHFVVNFINLRRMMAERRG